MQSVLDSLRRTVRLFQSAARVAHARLGISGAQHFALRQLAGGPGASLNELAARTMTHKSSASVVVSRLVACGLVRRRRSPDDAREIVLSLTPAGRRALARSPVSAQTRLVAALRRFDRRDLAAFERLFRRLVARLGAASLAPTMIFEDAPAERIGARARRRPRRR